MNTPLDLDAFHNALKSAFTAAFPDCFVDFYPRPGEKITTPAILLEVEDFSAGDPDDIGTCQLAVTLNVNAYVVLSYKHGKKQALRKFAATAMAFIHRKRWGVPVSPANVGSANPDRIDGQAEDYEAMRIEFTHEALLGADVFAGTGIVPLHVFLGISPLTGPSHLSDYREVTQLPV